MRFGRNDYNTRIVDLENKIPQDEPCFFLRGKDPLAPRLLLQWAAELRLSGGDPKLAENAENHAQEMIDYQKINGSKLADYDFSNARNTLIDDLIKGLKVAKRWSPDFNAILHKLSELLDDRVVVLSDSVLKNKDKTEYTYMDLDLDKINKDALFNARLVIVVSDSSDCVYIIKSK